MSDIEQNTYYVEATPRQEMSRTNLESRVSPKGERENLRDKNKWIANDDNAITHVRSNEISSSVAEASIESSPEFDSTGLERRRLQVLSLTGRIPS
ncbi:hypothetical protein Hte_001644 [Hypoxylon texense]